LLFLPFLVIFIITKKWTWGNQFVKTTFETHVVWTRREPKMRFVFPKFWNPAQFYWRWKQNCLKNRGILSSFSKNQTISSQKKRRNVQHCKSLCYTKSTDKAPYAFLSSFLKWRKEFCIIIFIY
jgi:hypothetical protein